MGVRDPKCQVTSRIEVIVVWDDVSKDRMHEASLEKLQAACSDEVVVARNMANKQWLTSGHRSCPCSRKAETRELQKNNSSIPTDADPGSHEFHMRP